MMYGEAFYKSRILGMLGSASAVDRANTMGVRLVIDNSTSWWHVAEQAVGEKGLLGLVLDSDIVACIVYLSGEGRESGGER